MASRRGKKDELKDEFTPKQREYVAYRVRGMTPYAAAKAIGDPTHSYYLERWLNGPKGQKLLTEMEATATIARPVPRAVVVDNLLEATEMARAARDPMGMIAANREIGRMFGYYEPERKEFLIAESIEVVQREIRSLSDNALLQIVNRKRLTLTPDGKVVEDSPAS
jgi:phage terminase small subunit